MRRDRTLDHVELVRSAQSSIGGLFAPPEPEKPELYAVGDPRWQPNTPIEHDFWAFHRANPHVYRALERLARDRHAAGQRVAIGKLFEDLRDSSAFRSEGAAPYKLNNNHRSLYARMIRHLNPEIGIGTRERKEQGAA